MSLEMPKNAMVLAAGIGKRLRPYTDETPKPLLPVGGKPLIDWALDHLKQAGVEHVVVNSFYQAGKLQSHLEKRMFPKIQLLVEEELLGTGGAIQNALPYLGDTPFFVLNSNIIWISKTSPALQRLAAYWDDARMDILSLIVDRHDLPWFKGKGDFTLEDSDYRMKRAPANIDTPIVSAGIHLSHPRIFKKMPDGAFPITLLLDEAANNGRLFGLAHQGEWYSISTTQEYVSVKRLLANE